jgi:uncharacterized protein (TIGR00251 family)
MRCDPSCSTSTPRHYAASVSGPVATLRVRVQPRARREEIVGLRDGHLVVRVKAPPTDGRANVALCRLIAAHVGLAPSNVSERHGAGSRDKLLELRGIDDDGLQAMLARW